MITNNINFIINNFQSITVKEIEKSDGRFLNAPRACKQGFFIYLLFNRNDEVLYIGQTRQSIKHRTHTDGNGSHKNCNNWWGEVEYVKYYVSNELEDIKERNKLKKELIKILNPKYNC